MVHVIKVVFEEAEKENIIIDEEKTEKVGKEVKIILLKKVVDIQKGFAKNVKVQNALVFDYYVGEDLIVVNNLDVDNFKVYEITKKEVLVTKMESIAVNHLIVVCVI